MSHSEDEGNSTESKYKKEPTENLPNVSFKKVWRYTNNVSNYYLMVVICSTFLCGQGFSTNSILLGYAVDVFLEYEVFRDGKLSRNETIDNYQFMYNVATLSILSMIYTVMAMVGVFLTLYHVQLLMLVILQNLKEAYFRQIVKMEIGWHDNQNSGEFATKIAGDFKRVESGINENFGVLLYHTVGGILNIAGAFFYGWELTLCIISVLPIIILCAAYMSKAISYYLQKETEANTDASSKAEEAISSIRTVVAFGAQRKEQQQYKSKLDSGQKYAYRRHFVTSAYTGVDWILTYVAIAIGVYAGVKLFLINPDFYTPGKIVIVYWCINGACYNLSSATPHFESFQLARSALKNIFKIIDSKSMIDSFSKRGLKFEKDFPTDIEFRNVSFSYPTRSEIRILKEFNLTIKSGEIVALVGASGCGKSTIIQLIQRFYDPLDGQIFLNGTDLRDLNIAWLRQQIGIVGQEPVLFDETIEANIRLGVPTEQADLVSKNEIVEVSKMANAHTFISTLSNGYQTFVGDRGAQLSGGQKQRIAIARALISNPRILLLDEATSALDLNSEKMVQEALDRAAVGRTTIIVAHRLSTIINANRIIFFENGKVLEMGTHSELMEKKSAYYRLVINQQLSQTDSPTVQKPKNSENSNNSSTCHVASVNLRATGSATNMPTTKSTVPEKSQEVTQSFPTDKSPSNEFPYRRIASLLWIDKYLLMIAITSATCFGVVVPLYAVIIGDFIDEFSQPNQTAEYMLGRAKLYSILYLILAIGAGLCCFVQISLFGIVSENLTKRLREMAFESIMSQEISWFDDSKHSSGALCSRLADDAANIQGATGLRISMVCQALSTLLSSMVIGFIYSWRLAVFSILVIPIIVVCGLASAEINSQQSDSASQSVQKSVKIVIDVMNGIRTVVSLHKEQYFVNNYSSHLLHHSVFVRKKIWLKSLMMALALSSQMLAYTLSFFFGGWVMTISDISAGDFFRVIESMIFGAIVISDCAILSTDFVRAKLAAISIFKLIDSVTSVHSYESDPSSEKAQGNVRFDNVVFSYPQRPAQAVLKGLSFTANRGETIALVGSSGCGKSTTIQLLEMFYYPTMGVISVDGRNIQALNRDWIRRQMALVSQEPVLFNYSIAENIAYGDNTRKVSMKEIKHVAKLANVLEFVDKLPQGLNTSVGSRGTQLSGGQKQRIAIARALVRDPPILLLDEATSALDTASEAIVQKALECASQGRTVLIIAHRLKTIVHADKILVFNKGVVVEEGKHQELVDKRGQYYELYTSAFSKS